MRQSFYIASLLRRQLWMSIYEFLRSTHHVMIDYNLMKTWKNNDHLFFFQKKISIEILHCDVMLFTHANHSFCVNTHQWSPWMVSREIIPPCPGILNGKSNSLFPCSSCQLTSLRICENFATAIMFWWLLVKKLWTTNATVIWVKWQRKTIVSQFRSPDYSVGGSWATQCKLQHNLILQLCSSSWWFSC